MDEFPALAKVGCGPKPDACDMVVHRGGGYFGCAYVGFHHLEKALFFLFPPCIFIISASLHP